MGNLQQWRFGDVAFEVTERAGSSGYDCPVYGVDKSIGLTSEPRYQSKNLQRYKRIDHGMFAYNPMRLNIGSIGYCFDYIPPGLVSPDYVVFACDPSRLLPKFCYYHTQSKPWKSWLSLAGEGSVRERIYFRKLAAYDVELPQIAYQQAAVEILASLDDKIELNQRMNETLEDMALALFRDWFVDFGPTRRQMKGATDPFAIMGGAFPAQRASALAPLFPAAFGEDGLPQGWIHGTAADHVDFNPKEPLKRGSIAPYSDMASLPTTGPLVAPPVKRAFKSGMRFRNGDALMARITPCLENGKAGFVDYLTKSAPVGWGSTEFFVLRSKPHVASQFAYCLVRDRDFRKQAEQSMTGTSGRQRAQLEVLKSYNLAVPDQNVHAQFEKITTPFFKKIRANGEENRTLAQMRDLLLPKLMSGEISINDAEAVG